MKKLLAILPILLISVFAHAQCMLSKCNDSLAYYVQKDTLTTIPGITNIVWSVAFGPGILGKNSVSGLKPGTTTVIVLKATQNGVSSSSLKTITVAPQPVIIPQPRRVTQVLFPVSKTDSLHFVFNDASTQ